MSKGTPHFVNGKEAALGTNFWVDRLPSLQAGCVFKESEPLFKTISSKNSAFLWISETPKRQWNFVSMLTTSLSVSKKAACQLQNDVGLPGQWMGQCLVVTDCVVYKRLDRRFGSMSHPTHMFHMEELILEMFGIRE